jgi:hypothetical protein
MKRVTEVKTGEELQAEGYKPRPLIRPLREWLEFPKTTASQARWLLFFLAAIIALNLLLT